MTSSLLLRPARIARTASSLRTQSRSEYDLAAIVLALVLAVALAGCKGCDGSQPPPSTAVTPTATAVSQPSAGTETGQVPGMETTTDCFVILDAEPDFGVPPLTVHFSAETDCTGSPVTLRWEFGDGATGGNDPNQSHTYEKAGDYVAVVTARASDGGSGSDEIYITVGGDLAD